MKNADSIPKIVIAQMDPPSDQLELSCLPSTFDPLVPGTTVELCEYALPGGRLTKLLNGKVTGPVIYRGKEIVEIHWNEKSERKSQTEITHWIDPDEDAQISLVMRSQRNSDGSGYVELVSSRFPRIIKLNDILRTEDVYLRGSRSASEFYEITMASAFRVEIGGEAFSCFKMDSKRSWEDQRLVETFIDSATGRAVYARLMERERSKKTAPDILTNTIAWVAKWSSNG
jgi:hypothetical protein